MRSPTTPAAVTTWDRNAARYDRQRRHELRAVWAAVGFADPQPDDRVLDVGTGTGIVLDMLRVRPRPPARVLAIDRSPGMLARLRPLPDGWSARVADATALPVDDGSVDVATACHLLHLVTADERHAILVELARVLVRGGRLVTVTPYAGRGVGAGLLDAVAAASPTRLGGLRTPDPRAAIRDAGFTPVRAAQFRHGYPSLVVLARRR